MRCAEPTGMYIPISISYRGAYCTACIFAAMNWYTPRRRNKKKYEVHAQVQTYFEVDLKPMLDVTFIKNLGRAAHEATCSFARDTGCRFTLRGVASSCEVLVVACLCLSVFFTAYHTHMYVVVTRADPGFASKFHHGDIPVPCVISVAASCCASAVVS